MSAERERRIAGIVCGVLRQALADAGARCLVLVADGSPESRLLARWTREALGDDAVIAAHAPTDEVAAALLRAASRSGPAPDAGVAAGEAAHALARLLASRHHGVVAGGASKTTLLLADVAPPETLLPLGDLYASQVAALAGGWSAPPEVDRLAEQAGGVERLDEALAAWIDERRPAQRALASLPPEAAREVERRVRAGRFRRRRLGLVPKLGARTLGIDLHA